MLTSISAFLCIQLYFINTDKYKEACTKALEASLVKSGISQNIDNVKTLLESKAKEKINPNLVVLPLASYQLLIKKDLSIHIPHTPANIKANKQSGMIEFTWGL